MLKIVLLTFFVLLSILTGLFPSGNTTPHTKVFNLIGYEGEFSYKLHIILGTVFFLVASFLAQQHSIDYMWK